mmetsp:Transcript_14836/g.26306  ORF Transcript_14836/g.26306 Transcript_14836/m.26306 type:complete len:93 (+) Transcript_14836:70-348(+)
MQMGAAVGGTGAKTIEEVLPDEAAREEIQMNIDLTYKEKEDLKVNVENLPTSKLPHVIDIIQKQLKLPGLDGGDVEIEVDINKLPTPTLRQL